ncbi:ATP-binding cassette domain-containing protein [Peptostreptococcus russellii]|uniref:ATP-binding cassette domain-containing protein n=1 Tax=Peptostreptococcus russellii TaxID=215200 RepID=UPI00162580E0|nr:ATP-binding cassette domain-containing protein [Peptostreptococcus russellii]MBC2578643.1 ATP-binding cassette domain-containing protein [Peptostreptococcus russellii]
MKFDLHIHSIDSKYKESDGIVDNSTIDNTEILLNKLNENEVGLFSITDHNRFNVELYNKLDNEIKSGKYENVKGIVAGVEFDVQIDNDMGKCHIITIFDAKNKEDNYKKIKECIEENKNKLEKKEDYYTRDKFESILKKIGLDVILIACQRNSLDKHDGKHNSLSESTKDSENLIMTGYINALEFQRPNVEGILKNNLRNIPVNIGLVMGSDCHDWSAYPNHDKKNGNKQFSHSRAKILPTFKGLLMAITSPETRINQQNSKNINYIEEFKIGENKVKLVNGINAIIGENGSGKSTLLKLLNNKVNSPRYVKNLVEINQLECENKYLAKKLFIGQGEIVQMFDNSTLFPKDNFVQVSHDSFRAAYSNYAQGILSYIKENIKKEEAINRLKKSYLEYSELDNIATYFIHIECDKDFSNIDNIHSTPKEELSSIVKKIETVLDEEYFKTYEIKIKTVMELLKSILEEIDNNYNIIKMEEKLKNIIASELLTYNLKIDEAASTQEKDQRDFRLRRAEFIGNIIDAIKKESKEIKFPKKPNIFAGCSKKPSCGFSFNSESNYNGKDVHDEFLFKMFNQNYADIEKLKTIKDEETLISAITGCTSYDQLENNYNNNLNKFLDKMCECKNYIVDMSNEEKSLGSTLGEQSLAYFKYITEFEKEKCIFLVDQPEDHISNNNISKKLIKYLNSIRNKKQVIIVTHNPLLVVNQDVEQVIYVEKNNNKINITSGCLEFEDDSVNMLELIAENMDGGKDSIEKRLKVYG